MSRETLREIGLAVLAAAVIALGPFTPNRLLPSLLIGGTVGLAIFGYRSWQRQRSLRPGMEHASDAGTRVDFSELLPWLALIVVWLLAFWPTAKWLYWEWTRSVWANDHGIFMPFIVSYLAWTILRDDPRREPDQSAIGFVLVGLGLVLSIADAMAETQYMGMLGLLVSLPGVALVLLGRRRTRLLAVPLVLSLLMTPIPYTLSTHLYLRHITAYAVEPLIRLTGIPVFREDTVMHLSSGTFVVADACSGFSTLYASIAVALVLFFLTRSMPRRLSILLLAPILAIAANVVRVLVLILTAHFVGQWTLDTPLHEATGVATFFFVLCVLFFISREASPHRETI